MFNLFALFAVFASTALAQSATTDNSTSTSAGSLIPSGISESCNSFLNTLNSDPSLTNCLSTMANVTSKFGPGNPTPSTADVTSALTNLCDDSITNACPQSSIGQNLTDFYTACSTELTTHAMEDVRNIYDVLYSLLPLKESVCSKDDSGNSCVNGPSTSTRDFDEDSDKSPFGLSDILALFYIKKDNGALMRRDQLDITPNFTAIYEANILFVFFSSNLTASQLCVTCLRQILTAYINFESSVPFAYGINNSVLLSSQPALYTAVQDKCPQNFLSGAVEAAGGLSGSSSSSAYGADYQRIITLVMGAVALVAVAL